MLDIHKRIHEEKKKTKKVHAPDQARYDVTEFMIYFSEHVGH